MSITKENRLSAFERKLWVLKQTLRKSRHLYREQMRISRIFMRKKSLKLRRVFSQKKRATQTRIMGKKVEPDNKGSRGENKRATAYNCAVRTKGPIGCGENGPGVVQNIQFQAADRLPSGKQGKKISSSAWLALLTAIIS